MRHGLPTTDPAAALAGILLPMGGHRGYALALLFEVLTGVPSGAPRIAGEVAPIYASPGRRESATSCSRSTPHRG